MTCSAVEFQKSCHWALLAIGILKLALDLPCWFLILDQQHTMFYVNQDSHHYPEKLFYGMHYIKLKFIIDVILDVTLVYAWQKRNKGLLIFFSIYNAVVGAITIVWLFIVNSSDSESDMYLFFVFVAPHFCSNIHANWNIAVAFFVIELILVQIVLPYLVTKEIKVVSVQQAAQRIIMAHLLQNQAGDSAPMVTNA